MTGAVARADDRAPRSIRALGPALAVALLAAGAACASPRAEREASAGAEPTPCASPHVAVRNDTRASIDVYAERDGRRELLATVFPGGIELPIGAADRRFVAFPTGADPNVPGYAHPVSFTIVCRGGPAGAERTPRG